MSNKKRQHFLLFSILISTLFLTACSMEIQHDLNEREANEIVDVLKKHGIEASKMINTSGRVPSYTLIVSKSESLRTIKVLQENNLPRRKEKGFNEIYGKGGMIPTATEERAKYLMALSGELSRTLKRISGVLDARVHLVIPKEKVLKNPDQKQVEPTASVLLVIRSKPRPMLRKTQVQSLIAGSLESLRRERVNVIMIPKQGTAAPESEDNAGTTQVLIVRVAKSDATKLKMLLGAMILGLVIFLGLFVWFFMRTASLKNQLKAMNSNFSDS